MLLALEVCAVRAGGSRCSRWRFVLLVLEVIRCVLLCMLEAVDGRLCLLEVLEAMRHVLLCMLEAAEGELRLLEVLEMLEAMRCVLLCVLEMLETMRCVLLCMLETVEGELCGAGDARGAGSDAPCAALYAGGRGG